MNINEAKYAVAVAWEQAAKLLAVRKDEIIQELRTKECDPAFIDGAAITIDAVIAWLNDASTTAGLSSGTGFSNRGEEVQAQ